MPFGLAQSTYRSPVGETPPEPLYGTRRIFFSSYLFDDQDPDGFGLAMFDFTETPGATSGIQSADWSTPVSLFPYSTINQSVRNVAFSSTGTYLYLTDDSVNHVTHRFTLSTPWDISNATASGTLAEQDALLTWGLQFSPNGQFMYSTVWQANTQYLRRSELLTPWDITTAQAPIDVEIISGISGGDIVEFFIRPNGEELFVNRQNPLATVRGFTLVGGWEPTSITANNNDAVGIAGTDVFVGIQFRSDGTRMFTMRSQGYPNSTLRCFNYDPGWTLTNATTTDSALIPGLEPISDNYKKFILGPIVS